MQEKLQNGSTAEGWRVPFLPLTWNSTLCFSLHTSITRQPMVNLLVPCTQRRVSQNTSLISAISALSISKGDFSLGA
jgi:hypothetical protein